MARTEKLTIALPPGFNTSKHLLKLNSMIVEKYGDGFEITHIDPTPSEGHPNGIAYATRTVALTEVVDGTDDPNVKRVELMKGTKPADGEKLAVRLADQYPGFEMVKFAPHLHWAEMRKLDQATSRCRVAVANALSVKPWLVQVTPRPDGGFDLELPNAYVPSKHDDKLDEVASVIVGKIGWYVVTDPAGKTASINPGDPPSFPPTVPYDFTRKPPEFDPQGGEEWAHIPIGVELPEPGDEGELKVLCTDFVSTAHMQVSGLSGGGKGVVLTSLISGALARGWELVILDPIKSGVDFIDFEPFVRPGGWGCEDLVEAVCALTMAYNEGARRKKLIKENRVQKWTQLPAELDVRPLLVVSDEVSSLLTTEPVPKLAKDSPLVLEIQGRNLLRATALNYLGRIARELRFVGVSLAVSSQVSSTTTGVPTEMRTNLGQKLLLGASPTDNNRRLALSAPDSVPDVPPHIAADPSGAARGVGVYEFEGQAPGVFKGFFAPPVDFASWLTSIKVPTTSRPRPTPEEVAKFTPSLEDDAIASAPVRGGKGFDPDNPDAKRGRGAKGADYGQAPSGSSISADFGPGEMCGTCGTHIDPLTGNCACSR